MTRIGNIAEAEAALARYIPIVKQITGKDITLSRMQPLMAALGNPECELKIIHIAGTSGKTSTAYYMAALLAQTGKKIGLTVSPHIDSVTERVQVNLQPLSEEVFCRELEEFLSLIESVEPEPSYFELLMAFAYWYFHKISVDYAVIETGFGGLHDASNIAQRADKICVLTDIGYDHMHVLGNTLEEIAGQKAGIMHPGNHAFVYDQSPAVMEVFQARAKEQQAILNVLGIMEEQSGEVFASLPQYQQRNWSLAKYVYDYIAKRDSLPSLDQAKLEASMQVQVPGRMDVRQVSGKTIIMDGAHNEQKMTAFVESFKRLYPGKKAAILLAQKQGKEYQAVLPLLKPICGRLITTTFLSAQDIPSKPIDPHILAQTAQEAGIEDVKAEPDYLQAYNELLKSDEQIIIITGSFYLLAALRPAILGS